MAEINVERVQASFNAVAAYGIDAVGAWFYSHLWLQHSTTRAMFPHDMRLQREKLIKGLSFAVDRLAEPDKLLGYLKKLGHQHAERHGVQPFHYPWVGESLIATLEHFHSLVDFDGPRWADVEGDWQEVYAVLSGAMILGAREGRASGADAEAALSPTSVSQMKIRRTLWGYDRATVESMRTVMVAVFEQAVDELADLRRQLAEADAEIHYLRNVFYRENRQIQARRDAPEAVIDDVAIEAMAQNQLAVEAASLASRPR